MLEELPVILRSIRGVGRPCLGHSDCHRQKRASDLDLEIGVRQDDDGWGPRAGRGEKLVAAPYRACGEGGPGRTSGGLGRESGRSGMSGGCQRPTGKVWTPLTLGDH